MTTPVISEVATEERNSAIAKKLTSLMKSAGWNVRSHYIGLAGSVYLKFEEPAEDGRISGKIRIADHAEQSENHVSPEIEILSDEQDVDWDELVAAVVEGAQGQW